MNHLAVPPCFTARHRTAAALERTNMRIVCNGTSRRALSAVRASNPPLRDHVRPLSVCSFSASRSSLSKHPTGYSSLLRICRAIRFAARRGRRYGCIIARDLTPRQERPGVFGKMTGTRPLFLFISVNQHKGWAPSPARGKQGQKKRRPHGRRQKTGIKKEASPDRPHFHSQSGLTSLCSWYLASWLPLFLQNTSASSFRTCQAHHFICGLLGPFP